MATSGRIQHHPTARAGRRPSSLSLQEKLKNAKWRKANPEVGAPPTATWTWKSINRKSAKENVRRLQERIAKATQLGKFNKVKALQRLLTC